MPTKNPDSSDSFRADGGTRASSRALAVGLGRQLTTTQDLDSLVDVTLATPADRQILQYEAASSQWKNVTPTSSYSKTEIDTKLQNIIAGLQHGLSVQTISSTPPASPNQNELFIVGTTPTGAWAGHANELALWDGAAWVFSAPQPSEAHLVEDQSATFSWNGTTWVKIATQGQKGDSITAQVISQADYTALGTKDPNTIYLITG
jgi:hypothetical protein